MFTLSRYTFIVSVSVSGGTGESPRECWYIYTYMSHVTVTKTMSVRHMFRVALGICGKNCCCRFAF